MEIYYTIQYPILFHVLLQIPKFHILSASISLVDAHQSFRVQKMLLRLSINRLLTPSLRGSKMNFDYGDGTFCSSVPQRNLIEPRTS